MLEEQVVEALRRGRTTLACAESCTGGLFGARLTRVPGAGEVFLGGVISYQDDVKRDVLRVDAALLRERGAVTAECARQMALGARALLRADLAVSITGFAGPNVPEGGERGLVHLALAGAEGVEARELHLPGDREAVREAAAEAALALVLDHARMRIRA